MQFTILTYWVLMHRLGKQISWSRKAWFAHSGTEGYSYRKSMERYKELAFNLHFRQSRERKNHPLSALQYFFIA